ncbi:MAG TPA: DUF4908 domain-containing protein [Caulobacteraceae bacterium]|jgi:hypothetical protein|nr:DUF4908 domain-containing protein [Caulobacteraceae bacterium]
MASTPRALEGWFALAAALAATGSMGFAPLTIAAPAWVKNALSLGRSDQMHNIPLTARFSADEGGWFILDRSHKPALLRFEDDADEVWVVSPSRGPRGDILFKDDVGDVLLRITKLGGVTVFTAHRPMGAAATLEGRAQPIHTLPVGLSTLFQRMALASARCTRTAHHLVMFDAPEADAHSAPALAAAAILAMNGVVAAAGHAQGKATETHLGKVMLIRGPRSGATLQRGVLTIVVNPGDGFSGLPSSARIAQVIEAP